MEPPGTTTRPPCDLWPPPSHSQFGRAETIPPTSEVPLTFAYRGVTVILVALALMGQAAYLDVLYWNSMGLGRLAMGGVTPALFSAVITGAVVSLVSGVLGVTMAFRGDGARGARPLGLALAAWSYLLAYSGTTVLFAPDLDSPFRFAFESHFLGVEALGLAALLRFTTLFPTPLTSADLRAPDDLAVGLRTAQYLRLLLLRAWGPWLFAAMALALVLGVNATMGRTTQDTALLPLTDIMRLAALAVVVLNLRVSFVRADRQNRRQMFWMVVGFTLLVGAVGALLGGNVLVAVTHWEIQGLNWRPIVLDLGVMGLLWGTAMGVFYNGAMRPGVFTRRATVLFSMLTMALFLAAGMETLLVARSLPQGIGTVLATVAVGLLFVTSRRPLESMLYHTWADRAKAAPE